MLEFKITKMNRLSEDDFVCDVYYTVFKKDGGHTASIDSTVSFVKQPEKTLIPYSNLTKSTVVDWVKNSIGVDSLNDIDAFLTNNITDQKSPKIISDTSLAQ
jgi:hypothetical protein